MRVILRRLLWIRFIPGGSLLILPCHTGLLVSCGYLRGRVLCGRGDILFLGTVWFRGRIYLFLFLVWSSGRRLYVRRHGFLRSRSFCLYGHVPALFLLSVWEV